MGIIMDNRAYLAETKDGFKNALIEKGFAVTDETKFREYVAMVRGMGAGGADVTIDDMSYFFLWGSRIGEFDEVNEKLIPHAKKLYGLFYGNTLGSFPGTLNCGNCEDLSFLCHGITNLYNVPVLDTSSAKNLAGVFANNEYLVMTSVYTDMSDVPLWDTSKVENMASTFYGCKYLFNKTGEFPAFNLQNLLTMNSMCYNCQSLKELPELNTAKCTMFASAFYGCNSLTTIAGIDMSSGTDANNMFNGCAKLPAITTETLKNTSLIENMTSMFEECRALESITIDMTSCTMAEKMFYYCLALTEVNLLNTGKLQNMDSLFSQCNALPTQPELDMSSCTTAQYLFNKCYALKEIKDIYGPVCTDISYFFRGCGAETISNISFPLATKAVDLLHSCSNLKKIDGLYLPKVTNFGYVMRYSTVMEELLNLDFSGCSGGGSVFSYNFTQSPTLRRLVWADTATSVPTYTIANCSFDRDGMVEMFNSLPTLTEGVSRTITITGNPCVTDGTLTDEDKAIAINKGYTLTI